MWAIRVLNGSLSGKSFTLKSGRNLLGRGKNCDIVIPSDGISKEHCEIHVFPEKIVVVDLKSSNGTFLNGVRIQSSQVRFGDKLMAHETAFEISPSQITKAPAGQIAVRRATAPVAAGPVPQLEHSPDLASPQHLQNQNVVVTSLNQFHDFVERVALPGVYKLAEWFEFRWVIGGFVVLFIFAVTILAMIPTFRSAKESVMGESFRRAQSVARHLAEINQKALLEGQFGALSTHSAELEEGVENVLIVQKSDGMILAPASKAGKTSEQPFVHQARSEDRPLMGEISSSQIGASAPIGQFDPATGLPSVKAYAIVIYNVDGRILEESRAVSLFMQILVLAAGIGFFLYFFLIKLIEKPIRDLNENLDTAMRDRRDNITLPYLFPPLQGLIANVNSLLSRSLHPPEDSGMGLSLFPSPGQTQQEALALVTVANGPAIAIDTQNTILAVNEAFSKLVGNVNPGDSYQHLPDHSLQQNIESLIQRCRENPASSHSDNLEFSGHPCLIQILAFHSSGNLHYFFLTIRPLGGDS